MLSVRLKLSKWSHTCHFTYHIMIWYDLCVCIWNNHIMCTHRFCFGEPIPVSIWNVVPFLIAIFLNSKDIFQLTNKLNDFDIYTLCERIAKNASNLHQNLFACIYGGKEGKITREKKRRIEVERVAIGNAHLLLLLLPLLHSILSEMINYAPILEIRRQWSH